MPFYMVYHKLIKYHNKLLKKISNYAIINVIAENKQKNFHDLKGDT